jgi:hypothetical protein
MQKCSWKFKEKVNFIVCDNCHPNELGPSEVEVKKLLAVCHERNIELKGLA